MLPTVVYYEPKDELKKMDWDLDDLNGRWKII